MLYSRSHQPCPPPSFFMHLSQVIVGGELILSLTPTIPPLCHMEKQKSLTPSPSPPPTPVFTHSSSFLAHQLTPRAPNGWKYGATPLPPPAQHDHSLLSADQTEQVRCESERDKVILTTVDTGLRREKQLQDDPVGYFHPGGEMCGLLFF